MAFARALTRSCRLPACLLAAACLAVGCQSETDTTSSDASLYAGEHEVYARLSRPYRDGDDPPAYDLHVAVTERFRPADPQIVEARRILCSFRVEGMAPGRWYVNHGVGSGYTPAPTLETRVRIGDELLRLNSRGYSPLRAVRLTRRADGRLSVRLVIWRVGGDGGSVHVSEEAPLAPGEERRIMRERLGDVL